MIITRACGHTEQINIPDGHKLASKKIECPRNNITSAQEIILETEKKS